MPTTTDLSNSTTSQPWDGSRAAFVLKNTIDLSDVTGGVAQNDVVKCLSVAAGTVVHRVIIKTTTAFTAAASDADFGDGDNVDGYIDGIDLTGTVGWYGATAGAYMTTNGGRLYDVADTIDYKNIGATTAAAGVFIIYAICTNLNNC